MKEDIYTALEALYDEEVPSYVQSVGKTYFTILVSDWQGTRRLKVTVQDIIDYYAKDARNITSGIRTLAGHSGDWRMIDALAQEVLEWFKVINRPLLVRLGEKQGLTLKV